MKNGIQKFSFEQNQIVSPDELKQITARLNSHMYNKLFFNPIPFDVQQGTIVEGAYRSKNLRQSYFSYCTFNNIDYYEAGLSGSGFQNCTFFPCNFYDTNLQSCNFNNCVFEDVKFEFTRMNKSMFCNIKFENCIFEHVSMNDSYFYNCEFYNCRWTPVSIENTVFKNTLFDSLIINNMNFEFSVFDNIKMNNVIMPFPTIPFIFNGLNYLCNTNDNIRITSQTSPDGLTVEEYLRNLPDLEKFYLTTKNFFPLSNIYICQKEYDKAYWAIVKGIEIAIKTNSFRMIKYCCQQLNYIDNIDIHKRQDIYNQIVTSLQKTKFNECEINILNKFLIEAKYILLNDVSQEHIQIYFNTNISNAEYDKMSILLSIIDKYLVGKCTYSVELRHNSDFNCLLELFSDKDNISIIIMSLQLLFQVVGLCYGKIKDKKHKQNNLDNIENDIQTLNKKNIKIYNPVFINNGTINCFNNESQTHNLDIR